MSKESDRLINPHSSQSSFSSTTSNLLKKSKDDDSLKSLEESAKKDRYRLSAMLDTYRTSSSDDHGTSNEDDYTDADEFIANRASLRLDEDNNPIFPSTSDSLDIKTLKEGSRSLHSKDSSQQFEFEKPQVVPSGSFPSRSSLALGLNDSGLTPALNRRSVISDYAASIHEVNKVEYVVGSEEEEETEQQEQQVPLPLPQHTNSVQSETLEQKIQRIPTVPKRPSVVKISRNPSKSSKHQSTTPEAHETESQENSNAHTKNKESVNSYQSSNNTNSNSTKSDGSSKYPDSNYSGKDSQLFSDSGSDLRTPAIIKQKVVIPSIEERRASTESFNFDLGPLHTKKEDNLGKNSDRFSTTSVDEAIPSRSPNRPISGISLKSPLDKIRSQELNSHRKSKSLDVQPIDTLVGEIDREISTTSSSSNIRRESTQTVSTDILEDSLEDNNDSHGHQRTDSNQSSLSTTTPRPLPPPPLPKHSDINSSRVVSSTTTNSKQFNNEDDGFVTEDEEADVAKVTRETKKKHKKKTSRDKKKRISSTVGNFNHETLLQMLQVTEGTIIGQEFQNIGLETNEKQLLERLVDSLSRLTADMIIDSERHDESVKRLNKAIKALEGF